MQCILNVTDHEYDKILQLTHSTNVWSTHDIYVLRRLETLLGSDVVMEITRYEECRMEKHYDVSNLPRVEPAHELAAAALTRIE